MKKFIPYIITLIIAFYAVPYLISLVPVVAGLNKMINIILIAPIVAIVSLIYTRNHGFSMLFPLIAIVIYLPYALLSHSPAKTIFSIVVYFISMIVGNLLGLLFKKNKTKKRA